MAGPDGVRETDRSTAPQSPYSGRDVGIGFLIFAVALGLLILLALLV